MRHRAAVAAATLVALACGTGTAAATLGPTGSFTAASDSWVFSGFIECEATLSGEVDGIAGQRGAGLGGVAYVTAATMPNCDFGAIVADTAPPWELDLTPVDADTNAAVLRNVRFTINGWLGFTTCVYEGVISATYEERANTLTFSNAGGLTETSINYFCPETPSISGVYTGGGLTAS